MSEDLDDFSTRPDLGSAGRGSSRRPSNRRIRSDGRRNCRCSLLGGSTVPPQRLQATPGAAPAGPSEARSSFGLAKRAPWAAESVRGMPTKAPGDLQKPTKTLYFRRISVFRPDEGAVPPRALHEPARRRRDLPRSRPRAVRIGPGRRPGPSRTAPERSKRTGCVKTAPEPPKSRQDQIGRAHV